MQTAAVMWFGGMFIMLVLFIANMPLRGRRTQLIESILGLLLCAMVVATFFVWGFWAGAGAAVGLFIAAGLLKNLIWNWVKRKLP